MEDYEFEIIQQFIGTWTKNRFKHDDSEDFWEKTLAMEIGYLSFSDFNEMSQGNDISLWKDDIKTNKRFVGYDMVSLEDGTSRPLYKYYNYDKDMWRDTPANLEVIDHIGCRNMFYGLLNYFDEPEHGTRPNNTEWLGNRLNMFIQNGKIVYKAPAEDYIELSWIDKLIATKIEDVYAKQSQKDSILEKGLGSIYNVIGQRINGLQKGLNIVEGKKVVVR